MLLTPRAPNAGPTGGEGEAFPAGTTSLFGFDELRKHIWFQAYWERSIWLGRALLLENHSE